MSYGVKLSKNTLEVSPEGNYRLQIWVSQFGEGTDPKIFVYQRYPTIPKEPADLDDQFVCVASLGDMYEYPEDAPNSDTPFFRQSSLDLEFESVDLMNHTWRNIKLDVADLINNLNDVENDDLAETEVYTI